MTGEARKNAGTTHKETKLMKQPPCLNALLRAIDVARKQSSLYGADHPNTDAALNSLVERIKEFVADFKPATCIFSKDFVIVNDHQYQPTDCGGMFHRLRARGVLGVTFLDEPDTAQVTGFLSFLNAEPNEVKRCGGPDTYLRQRSVTKVVVTQAVYSSGDGESGSAKSAWTSGSVDSAIGAVIDWLVHEDKDEDKEPEEELPITEILSDPDAAAKLIREAVTKLHKSRHSGQTNELASDVLDEMKSLSADRPAEWDKAAPQIRKAVAKLPSELRPRSGGLGYSNPSDEEKDLARAWQNIDAAEVEAMVAEKLGSMDYAVDPGTLPPLEELKELFTVAPGGLITSWKNEMRPETMAMSFGSTFGTLLELEHSPTEHARLASSLAALIPKSIEMRAFDTAMHCAQELADQARQAGPTPWRSHNAKAALQSVDAELLKSLVDYALQSERHQDQDLASDLVESLPTLALSMAGHLGTCGNDSFDRALRRGIVALRSAAISTVGQMLHSKSPTQQEIALEMLVEIGTASAALAIVDAISRGPDALVVRALRVLPGLQVPVVTQACARLVNHRSAEVRSAAIHALGRIGDPSVIPDLEKVASVRLFGGPQLSEQTEAIKAIGAIEGSESSQSLERLASKRSLLCRGRAIALRTAAASALAELALRHPECQAA